jgi:hypothetical protein
MKTITTIQKPHTLISLMLVILLLVTTAKSYSQEVKKVGTSSAAFLKIPVGSRGASMGSAFVSLADDPSALYWNPGGLSRNQN